MSLLACRNATFSYEGAMVLSDLNFSVETGDYLCIVGENGAGKSTLLKGLLHLKKPSGGEISTGDGLRPTEIGYLPQQTAAQKDFPASVLEVVLSGRLNHLGLRPFYGAADRDDARQKLNMLGALDLEKRCYRDLSGGQQQRVLLARALCATKKLLLLDEPVTGLDPIMTADLYRVICALHDEQGITMIMVSHDVRGAIEQSNHVLHLGNRQLFYGSTEDYRHSEIGMRFLGGRTC
ncbi:High-affinity zinc uptake system ATP-binding protein ZnuC [bioreactor metagenome]|uniref:High-affinity zinc uptake system ATP-binding protein ZnuC n=1 Tax=bioreactor metagenome TaxID=1076179 RepID=A0A644ZQZ0_9ZZZZ